MTDRQGVVFIAAEVHHGVRSAGYWDSGDRSDIEEIPEPHCAADALAWGLSRADDVRIRFDGCGDWWTGRGSMPEPTQHDDEGFMGAVSVRR